MTSDAKIGLLLGLVFIFIIAFIINGLPSLKNEPNGNELTTEMAEFDEPQVLAEHERSATRRLIDEALNYDTAEAPVNLGPVAIDDSPSTSEVFSDREMFDSVPGLGYDSGSLVALDTSGAADTAELHNLGLPSDERVTIDLQPEVEAANEVIGETIEPTPTVMDIPDTTPVTVNVPEPTNTRMHVVAKGENLGAIARKYYGPEEGNRMVNVNRIYEANKTVLKSRDAIFIGQELTIPPLPDGSFFHAAGSPPSTTPAEKPKPQPRPTSPTDEIENAKWYIVKDGDCLSKIAMNELGTVKRLDELTKINEDLLKGTDVVVVGMKIRLPQQ